MAVTTGTTWDAILSAVPRFQDVGSAALSVRAAYQEALYERAQLIDLRDNHTRADGEIHPDFSAVTLRTEEVVAWLLNHPLRQPAILLSSDGETAKAVAGALAELGLATVRYAVGGFDAWQAAGLPAHTPG